MLDILFLIILSFYMIKGYRIGLILAIVKACAIMIGLVIATHLSVSLSKTIFGDYAAGIGQRIFPLLTFGILFFIVKYTVTLFGAWLQKLLSISIIGTINRIGGAIIYGLVLVFIASIVLYFLRGINLVDMGSSSIVVQKLLPISPMIYNTVAMLIPFVRDTYAQLDAYLGQHIP